MMSLDRFATVDEALEAVRRPRGFDPTIKPILDDYIERGGSVNLVYLFSLSAAVRARGLFDGAVREIEAGNPHSTFPLIRQLAETVALAFYVAEHPRYIEALVDEPRNHGPGTPRRKSPQALVNYMDATRTSGFARVYRQLSEITHFGSIGLWAGHQLGEDHTTTWTSYPQFRDNQDLIACGWLIELAEMTEQALERLGNALLATTKPEDP